MGIKDVINEIKEKTKLRELFKKYGLSEILLYNYLQHKGYDNKTIAHKLGIHLRTVERYRKVLGSMKESEYTYLIHRIQKREQK